MANEIVYYDSDEVGAPTLNNVAGSLDAVLYACLVTGFRTQSLTSVTVAGGVATATLTGHGYAAGRMVDIAGCSAPYASLNTRHKITVPGSGTFTFPAAGLPDGTVTGAITAKRSPLGWSRPASSGNVSIYARTDVTATTMKLRVDDSGSGAAAATYARARMVETFSDINTFTNPAPPNGVLSDAGVYWTKGANSDTAKKWLLVGDSRTFYLFAEGATYPANSFNGAPHGVYGFGDGQPLAGADAYCCFVAGAESTNGPTANDFGAMQALGSDPPADGAWWPRLSTGIGGPVRCAPIGHTIGGSARRPGGGGPAYPSPVDNGMALQQPIYLAERNATFGHPLRALLRGAADPLANLTPGGTISALNKTVLTDLEGTTRDYLLVAFQQNGSYGVVAFDITGPWA